MNIPTELIPKRTTAVAWQTIGGELVLLRVEGRELLGVNDVGTRIWELADGDRSVAQIARGLTVEFDVDEEKAVSDAWAFVSELVELGAIELCEPDSEDRS